MATINFDQNGGNPCRFLPDWNRIRQIKRVTFQLELASRLHWQVFLEFDNGVSITQIQDDMKLQKKKIAIKEPGEATWHPNRGRNYVTKGTAVDGHRYFWSKAKGYEGAAPTTDLTIGDDYSQIKRGLRCIHFDGKNVESIKNRLKDMHEECVNYILQKCEPVKRI